MLIPPKNAVGPEKPQVTVTLRKAALEHLISAYEEVARKNVKLCRMPPLRRGCIGELVVDAKYRRCMSVHVCKQNLKDLD